MIGFSELDSNKPAEFVAQQAKLYNFEKRAYEFYEYISY